MRNNISPAAPARTLDVSPRRPNNDRGVTLVELLVSMVITGTIISTIALAFSVVLNTAGPAEQRISESKDVSFAQTFIPIDMASALPPTASQVALGQGSIIDDPTFDPPGLINAAGTPPGELPGTNVISMRRADVTPAGIGAEYWVSYRYFQEGSEWVMRRFVVRDAGTASESIEQQLVATELSPPVAGWREKLDKPVHAVELNARNQVVLRPVGEDLTLTFDSGSNFTTGGSAISKGLSLATNNFGGFAQTTAPPSKCGGDLALIIDTSGSVVMNNSGLNGGVATELASEDFIEAFSGTPTRLAVYGYDRSSYQMYPSTPGSLISMLDPTNPQIDAAIDRILALDDYGPGTSGGTGPGGQRKWGDSPNHPDWDDLPANIHWDQLGSGTNWEDGVRIAFFATEDVTTQYAFTPSLAVLITDGSPNRTISGGDATNEAAKMVAAAKNTGARVVGVLVGNADAAKMGQVVGTTAYDPALDNAASANYFRATNNSFDQLGDLLLEIAISECGGTVTVQKMIDTGSGLVRPPDGVWNYTSENGGGTAELDREKVSSVTFDYTVPANGTIVDTIYEQVGGDYVFDRYECYSRGQLLDPTKVSPAIDIDSGGVVPGVAVEIGPDSAISCLMISVPK